jgi:hypothetical protein
MNYYFRPRQKVKQSVSAGSYNPIRLSDKGDVLFLAKKLAGEAPSLSKGDFSIKLHWRDAQEKGAALCFIDVRWGKFSILRDTIFRYE